MLPSLDRRLTDRVLDPLADHVEFPLELRLVQHVTSDENLPDGRFRETGLGPDRIALHRHIPPAEQPRVLFRDHSLKECLTRSAGRGLWREKDHTDAILARVRQLQLNIKGSTSKKFVWDLQQNSSSVTGARITALRTTVIEILQDLESPLDDRARAFSLNVNYEANSTAVFFELWIIEPLFWRQSGDVHV